MTHVSYAPFIEKYRLQSVKDGLIPLRIAQNGRSDYKCRGYKSVWFKHLELIKLLEKSWYFGLRSVVRNLFQSHWYQSIQENAKYSKNCDQKFLFLSHQILLYSRSKFYAHQSINKFYVLTLFTILDFPLSKQISLTESRITGHFTIIYLLNAWNSHFIYFSLRFVSGSKAWRVSTAQTSQSNADQ